MERRREPRISSNQLVWLTVLGENEVRCRATTIDLSGRGMKLMAAWRFSHDAAVKVESDDALYLGEICYCRPENGGFIIGIEVNQVLNGLRDLAQLRRRLAEDCVREASSENTDTTSRDDEYRQLREVARGRV